MKVNAHSKTGGRAAVSLVLVCAMFALGLYLYSPWHQHQAGGRQACRFLQYEQSNGLEAHGQVSVEPPSAHHYRTPDGQTPLAAKACRVKFGCRAPPV